jgi:uncharacterized protein YbjT (DUF2867 family)
MKIVIIGGTGLIGSKLANRLRKPGHKITAAAPNTGVNTITGEGLAEALEAADTVVDVANSPSFEDKAVLEFFETSGRNLLAAEAKAGVKHHVALSVVGSDRLPDSGYLRAKMAQERLIKQSGIPYTILRSTQFFEFAAAIAQSATTGQMVHMPPALIQPIASDDVIPVLAELSIAAPLNGTVEIGGPEKLGFDEWIRHFLELTDDSREVITDIHARYYGTELNDQSLVAGQNAHIGKIKYEDWFRTQPVKLQPQH